MTGTQSIILPISNARKTSTFYFSSWPWSWWCGISLVSSNQEHRGPVTTVMRGNCGACLSNGRFFQLKFSGASSCNLGVSPKIGGFFPPKWMVKIMVPNPVKMDDLGGNTTYFWFNTHLFVEKKTGIKAKRTFIGSFQNATQVDCHHLRQRSTASKNATTKNGKSDGLHLLFLGKWRGKNYEWREPKTTKSKSG